MNKWIAAVVSGVVGVALAAVAAWGVVASNTAAPSVNPAPSTSQQVQYGDR